MLEEPLPRSRIEVRRGRTTGSSAPAKCRHCSPAPCESACPSGAITRNAELGLVAVDESRCTACSSCAAACPFGVVACRTVATALGARKVAAKCDGCELRLAEGRPPACTEACKSGALLFAEREVPRPSRVRDPDGLAAAGEAAPAAST
jgi:carbon-monoxide dehydrogenase iron sulfur subunit